MTYGRVVDAYVKRLATSVTTTVVGDNTTKTIPVDAFVVHFDEDGGTFQHMPTGDIYAYSASDSDLETITLTSGLPVGKTLTADDALRVVTTEDGDDTANVLSDDLYVNVAIDDVTTDTVPVRVPREFRDQIKEGNRKLQKGDVVEVDPGDDEWTVTKRIGQPEPGPWEAGDLKATARDIAGSATLIDRQWLKCDGSTVSRAKFPDLFNAIGTLYGSTSSTNFKLPDYRDRTMFGTGTQIDLGETDGAALGSRGPGHTHSIASGGDHDHNISNVNHSGASNATNTGAFDRVTSIAGSLNGSHNHSGTTGPINTNHAHGGATGISTGEGNPIGFIGGNWLIHI